MSALLLVLGGLVHWFIEWVWTTEHHQDRLSYCQRMIRTRGVELTLLYKHIRCCKRRLEKLNGKPASEAFLAQLLGAQEAAELIEQEVIRFRKKMKKCLSVAR
jgi:hypothetical protein